MVTSPTKDQELDFSKSIEIKWNSVSTDPSTFQLVLVDQSTMVPVTISDSVKTSDNKYTLTNFVAKEGAKYKFNLNSVDPLNNGILAQSETFEISKSGSTATTTSTSTSASVTTSTSTRTTGTGAVATVTDTSSSRTVSTSTRTTAGSSSTSGSATASGSAANASSTGAAATASHNAAAAINGKTFGVAGGVFAGLLMLF